MELRKVQSMVETLGCLFATTCTECKTSIMPAVMSLPLIRSGAKSFVLKPVNFTQFSKAVRQPGLYRPLLNELPITWGRGRGEQTTKSINR